MPEDEQHGEHLAERSASQGGRVLIDRGRAASPVGAGGAARGRFSGSGGGRHGLQAQMLTYVGFLGTVFLTLAVEITVLLRGARVRGVIEAAALQSGVDPGPFLEPLDLVLAKTGLMLAILLLSVALVMALLVKRITIPLSRIIGSASRIGSGDLSVVLRIDTHDELGMLARSINDLAANYQEILLLSGDLTRRAREALDEMRQAPEGPAHALAAEALAEALKEMGEVVDEFGKGFFGAAGAE